MNIVVGKSLFAAVSLDETGPFPAAFARDSCVPLRMHSRDLSRHTEPSEVQLEHTCLDDKAVLLAFTEGLDSPSTHTTHTLESISTAATDKHCISERIGYSVLKPISRRCLYESRNGHIDDGLTRTSHGWIIALTDPS